MTTTTIRALMTRPTVREVLTRVGSRDRTNDGTSTSAARDDANNDASTASPNGSMLLTPAAEDATRAALARIAAAQMPWYLRALIAVGAWVGASFFISTIVSLILMASGEMKDSAAIVIGIAFLSAATLLRQRASGTFSSQLALVVSFTGQVLLVGGTGEATDSTMAARIVMIISSLALIAFFPDRIQRFCATLAIFGAIGWYVTEHRVANAPDVLAFVLIACILVLWRFAPRDRIEAYAHIVEPVVYGLIASLLIVLTIHTVVSMIDLSESPWLRLSGVSLVTFDAALLMLTASLFIEHGRRLYSYDALQAFMAIIVLSPWMLDAPPLVACICLLVLGFDRRSRMLMALASVFFLGFLAAFYYDMRLTLLQKSGLLVFVGSMCLASAGVLYGRNKWSQS